MPEESWGGLALGGPEEQYALLMECVTDYAIFLMDTDGRVAAWNAGAERIFGYSEEEAMGLAFDRFFTQDDVERGLPEKELKAAVTHGRASDDKWHVRKDGTQFWVSGITTALRDDDGDLRGFAKVTRDRTERKESEELLRQEQRRRDEFLAMLAHELRGPLAPVRNAVRLLQLRGVDDPEFHWSREIIERQVQHLSRLVDDLHDITGIKHGKVKIDKQPVELATAIRGAVEASSPLISARRHHLSVSLPEQTIRLQGDLTRLTQIFGNLLTNSAKYTPEGGRIELTAKQDGDVIVVRVCDSGIGIPAPLLPRVFDLFAQGERGADTEPGGLGIGLSLVKSLIEMHGGSVTAQSDGAGKGSEFIVRLPCLPNEAAGQSEEPNRSTDNALPKSNSTCRVLVVDDNRDAANSMALLLKSFGHEIRVAHDGTLAVEVACEFKPEVVLLDIGLPGMSGYDVGEQLRKLPGMDKTFLIALTGYGNEEDRRRTHEAGFHAHLVKPADLDELQALLARLRH